MDLRPAARLPDRGSATSAVVVGLIAGDYPTLRRTAQVLRGAGFEIAGLACEMGEVVVEAVREEPEVIVLNPADSVRDLSTQISTLRKRLGDVGVVVVMKSAKPRDLRRALDAGVDGIVLEGQMQLVLPLTVRTVCAGQLSLPDEARAHVHHEVLSYRERQVLGAVAEGLTNREIAFRLKLSQSTVKRYLSTSFTKLGVRSRDEAAAAMIETDDGRQRAADSLGLALTHR